MASKVVNTRIQLKSDTEAHWNQSALIEDGGTKTTGTTFVPLAGELIIYSPDNGSPAYCRLKVGDGIHSVPQLPFIDAGTINGETLMNMVTNTELADAMSNIQLPHKLTFGSGGTYVYDGSADVTVPVYTGAAI